MSSPFYNRLLAIGSFLGAFGVISGAFGAHFLKSRLGASDLEIIRTGVMYLFFHVLVIIAIVLLARDNLRSGILRSSGIFFVSGIILFTGSLFIIATQSLTGFEFSLIGLATPLGGLCFISGWVLLFVYAISRGS